MSFKKDVTLGKTLAIIRHCVRAQSFDLKIKSRKRHSDSYVSYRNTPISNSSFRLLSDLLYTPPPFPTYTFSHSQFLHLSLYTLPHSQSLATSELLRNHFLVSFHLLLLQSFTFRPLKFSKGFVFHTGNNQFLMLYLSFSFIFSVSKQSCVFTVRLFLFFFSSLLINLVMHLCRKFFSENLLRFFFKKNPTCIGIHTPWSFVQTFVFLYKFIEFFIG